MATVYKTTADGVYKTTDNGNNWSDVTPDATYEYVDLVKKDNDTVYVLGNKDTAGEFESKLWKTTDSGATWPTSAMLSTEGESEGCLDPGTTYAFDTEGSAQYGVRGPGYDQLGTPIIEISSGKFVVCYRSGDLSLYVCAFTFSGDVPSYGTPVAISDAVVGYGLTLFEVDSTTFGLCYWESNGPVTGSGNSPVVAIGTVSGTVVSLGSANHVLTQDEYNLWLVSQNQRAQNFAAVSIGSSIVVLRFGNKTASNGSCTTGSSGWYLLWGTRSGTSITFGTETCGTSDLKTVGLWRTVDTNRFVLSMDCEGITMSSSYGLFVYHHADDDELVAIGVGSSENSFATTVITDSGWYPSSEFNVRKLTSTKAMLVHTSTLVTPFDEELYARMINLSTLTPSVETKYHMTGPAGEENYTDIAVGRLSDTDAIVYFIEWWVQAYPCVHAMVLTSSGNTITVDEWCKRFVGEFNMKVPIGRTSTTFISAESVSGTNANIRTGLSVTDVATCLYAPQEARGISIAVSGDQQNAYVTFCDGASLQLTSLSANDLSEIRTKSLGEATMAEVASSIKIAYPTTTGIENDRLWVFGRMINPAGLAAASPVQIIRSQDAGQTFDIYQNGWGDDVCGAAFQRNTVAPFYSVRNFAGLGQAMFYTNKIATGGVPFHVHNRAMYIPRTQGYAILGGSDVQEQRLYYAVQPFTRWYNVTRNYPNTASSNGGAITGVTVI